MIALRESFPPLTPEEYLDWEERQEQKYEYLNGEIYAMTGGTVNHSEVALIFGSLFRTHLRGSGCRILGSDAKVSIAESTNFLYPDVSVTCDERDRTATKYISHPCLIVEILSPSTANYDRGEKFRQYKKSVALQEYVLVSAEQMEIDIYRRAESNRWYILNYTAGDTIELTSIGLNCPIEQFYADIIFLE
jgi:Uma2 family endonuclease